MKKLIVAIVLFLNVSYCFSATDGLMVGNDSRVRVFDYKDSEIYNIYLSEGKALVIEFEPGEEVMQKGIGIGSAGAIDVGKNKNILMVKPRSINYNTNLIVVTNKRNYVFNVLKPTNKNVALYKVVFNYGNGSSSYKNYSYNNDSSKSKKKSRGFFGIGDGDKDSKDKKDDNRYSRRIRSSTIYNKSINNDDDRVKSNIVGRKDSDLPPAIAINPPVKVVKPPVKFAPSSSGSIAVVNKPVARDFKDLKPASHYDYIVKGDRELIPLAIFDDGHSLNMAFRSRKEIPLIYKLDNRNRERLIRPKIKNNIAIINEIPFFTILKKGKKSLQIKRMNKVVVYNPDSVNVKKNNKK